MSIDTGTPSAPARAVPAPDGWTRRDRVAGWLLTAAWVALLLSALVTGQRASTFADLEGQVAAGQVGEVEVVGEQLPDDAIGYGGVQVRWREGWILHAAWVTEASSERQTVKARRSNGDPVIVGSVEDRLLGLDPDVAFTRGDYHSPSFTLAGLEAPGWVGSGYLVLLVGTFALIGGPRPWRATRWAWAWLVLLVPPYGVAAYLLLGGPTGLLPPRDPRRTWLTGGWAFLLALILGGGSAAS
ncbi:hypothetical protein [Nocardioides sp. Soil805]|uniref:hypothetical protein n=1 Tax=Nocardioides sp. Soil805 TaxID=1736416 RepID=UPI00070389C3|nr:hypothetical protein [Nocardioides sp. Soil805]KRF37279.1 hypothetical protein ASG94_08060 [Nocardioides sp. Soil805]